MDVWFAERRYALTLERRADVEYLGLRVVGVPVEYLYILAMARFLPLMMLYMHHGEVLAMTNV